MALIPEEIEEINQLASNLRKWADNLSFNHSPSVVKLSPSFGTDKVILWLLAKMPAVGQRVQQDFNFLDRVFNEADSRSRKLIINEEEVAEFDNLVNTVTGAAYQLADRLLEIVRIAREDLSIEGSGRTKREREGWLWKLYEKTLKVIIDAVLEKVWPK